MSRESGCLLVKVKYLKPSFISIVKNIKNSKEFRNMLHTLNTEVFVDIVF